LSLSTPSRGIIALLGLFYPDASYYMAHKVNRAEKIQLLASLYRSESMIDFDENTLDTSIRQWITEWVSLVDAFLFQDNASLVMTKKFLEFLDHTHKDTLQNAISEFFVFFFSTRNIHMSQKIGKDYAQFIQKNLIESGKKHLQHHLDDTLLEVTNIHASDLF
jgi:adenylosuccinate lyase